MPPDAPLTRDRILAAAEDVIRRFGPSKATVVDVARALGVSHTAVYKHVATQGRAAGSGRGPMGRGDHATAAGHRRPARARHLSGYGS